MIYTSRCRMFLFAPALITLMLSLIPTRGAAIVDMKNANYTDTWVDITLAGSGYSLRVNRTYNSRSVFNGIFGFGWCSDFETVIERLPEGRLKLTECGAGQEILFNPSKFESSNIDRVTEAVVNNYKKKNPNATNDAVETLRRQVRGNDVMRSEMAKDAGIITPEAQKGMVYTSESLGVETITFDGSQYNRVLADGTSQRFDTTGHLSMFYDKNSNYLKLTYTGGQLKEVADNTGKKLSFSFYPNHRVKEILAPGNIHAEYKYKGEDLVEVKNMWKNSYSYTYDETHNLTRINFPDNTFKALGYNSKKDWVVSFTDRASHGVSCTENYTYEVDRENPKEHFWSLVTKKCGAEVVNESRFEFWHKVHPNGTRYLARALSKSSSDSLDVTYHPDFGRPLSIKKNGVTTTFDYYANGLVKTKTTNVARMTFEYKNSFNKVSKVSTNFFDDKGKVLKTRETVFNYDQKSNLVTAQNTDGQSVKLAYDERGRISMIADQAKKEVLIKYDERTGKPATITRPKVGSINVNYKANGEINKVESSDGAAVAVQIASTFSNLLDIISPATSDLSL